MSNSSGGGRFRFKVKVAGQEWDFTLDKSPFTLGRTAASNAVVPLQILSAVHLQFMHIKENTWMIVDKKSTNGTAIDGQPMAPHTAYRIKSPMKLRVGKNTDLEIEIEEIAQTLDRSVTKVPQDLQMAQSPNGTIVGSGLVGSELVGSGLTAPPVSKAAPPPEPAVKFVEKPLPAPQVPRHVTSPAFVVPARAPAPVPTPSVSAAVPEAHATFEEPHNQRDLAADLRRLELKISEAIQSEQRFKRESDLAQKAYEAAEAKKIEIEKTVLQAEHYYEAKKIELEKKISEVEDLFRAKKKDIEKKLLQADDLFEAKRIEIEKKVLQAENVFEAKQLEIEKKVLQADDLLKAKQIEIEKKVFQAEDLFEAKKVEIEKRVSQTQELLEKSQVELYEFNAKIDALRLEHEDKQKHILEIESDIKKGEKRLASSLDEKKACDLTLVELQRKINGFIEQEKDLKRAVSAAQSESEAFLKEREKALSLLEATQVDLKGLDNEVLEKRKDLEEITEFVVRQEKSLKESIEKESEAHKEFHKSLKMLSEKEIVLKEINERIDDRQKELELKRQSVDKVNVQLEAVRKLQLEEEREHQESANKLNSVKENFQLIESQKKVAEATLDSLRTEQSIAEARSKKLLHEANELEERIATFTNDVDEKQRLDKEIAATKAEFIEWERAEKERVLSLRTAKSAELEEWAKAEKERIHLQYSNQVEKTERDLAGRRQKELQSIEELKSKWNKERAARRPLEIREIVRSSGDILSAHLPRTLFDMEKKEALLAAFKKDIEDVVKAVLVSGEGAKVDTHLKSALVQSPEATLKAKKKRKIWAAQAATVMSLIAIGAIFPQIPQAIYNAGKSVVTRNPQSADAFVERLRLARANRPKFMPKRDHEYRTTYVDNILYLADYAEIKADDELKKAWTLSLNQFFLKRRDIASDAGLELDEKVIVTFMGIESPMVRELLQMSSRIQINTQEADIQRMKDFEAMNYSRLVEAVKGEDNYKKLRRFEEEFYKKYSSKLK